MPMTVRPEFKELTFTVRFIKGYRYLDRCGEALVRLEETLEKGWITGEVSPKAGSLRHFAFGLLAQFNSEHLKIDQVEFIDPDLFTDQACKILEILWRTFEISAFNVPTLRTAIQVGFNTPEEAEEYIRGLPLVTVNEAVPEHLGGKPAAVSYAVCTEADLTWHSVKSRVRNRLAVQTIRQTRQPDYDARVMMRVPLIPSHQQDAVKALLNLRRKHSSTVHIAAELDLEQSLESEFPCRTFPTLDFITERIATARAFLGSLPK